ncbi:hexokinase-2-like isoform X3, partial [Leptotrombidium deliense]
LLVTWTKCYDLPDVVNKNAVEFLQKALSEKQLNVEIVAILNDTTGTLVKGAYLDDHCGIGMILGTGFNICYIEKAKNVEKWSDRHKYSQVLVDMECGAFGDNGCIDFMKTEFDRQIDGASLFKGSFTYANLHKISSLLLLFFCCSFEKLFSGRFAGDLVRRILLHLCEKGLLFGGQVTSLLTQPDSLTSALVSLVEEENTEGCETRKAIESLGYSTYTPDDMRIVKYVCAIVSVRGALLVSILLSVLLERMQKETVSIAIDGSLFSHPKYSQLLNDFVSELAPGRKFKLFAAKDGSGKGAGIVAAIADRMKRSATTMETKV